MTIIWYGDLLFHAMNYWEQLCRTSAAVVLVWMKAVSDRNFVGIMRTSHILLCGHILDKRYRLKSILLYVVAIIKCIFMEHKCIIFLLYVYNIIILITLQSSRCASWPVGRTLWTYFFGLAMISVNLNFAVIIVILHVDMGRWSRQLLSLLLVRLRRRGLHYSILSLHTSEHMCLQAIQNFTANISLKFFPRRG